MCDYNSSPSPLTMLYGETKKINGKWFGDTKHKLRVDRNQYGVSVDLFDPVCPEKGSYSLTGKCYSPAYCLKKLRGLDSSGVLKEIRKADFESRKGGC